MLREREVNIYHNRLYIYIYIYIYTHTFLHTYMYTYTYLPTPPVSQDMTHSQFLSGV